MTREEKIATAKRMREEGATYQEISDELGVGRSTVYRWINPTYENRQRAVSLRWKQRNLERKRAYDRDYKREHRPDCPRCGQPMRINGMLCASCRFDEVERRRKEVVRLWAEGWSLKEIAARYDWSPGRIAAEFDRMRKDGWDLPYRYRVVNGLRVAA